MTNACIKYTRFNFLEYAITIVPYHMSIQMHSFCFRCSFYFYDKNAMDRYTYDKLMDYSKKNFCNDILGNIFGTYS